MEQLAPKNEGEEKQAAFETNQARVAAIAAEMAQAVEAGDDDKIAELAAERKSLKVENEGVVAEDEQEGMEMNADFAAEKSKEVAEAKQKEAEAMAVQTDQARLDAESATADQAAAEELAKKIKGGENTEPPLVKVSERAQEVLDWASSRSEQSRESAKAHKEQGLTGYSEEDDILLSEREQLMFKMDSGHTFLTKADRLVIQERVSEIDSNPLVMSRLQERAEYLDPSETENLRREKLQERSPERAAELLEAYKEVADLLKGTESDVVVKQKYNGTYAVDGSNLTPDMKSKMEEFLNKCEMITTTVPGLEGVYKIDLVIDKANKYSVNRFLEEVKKGLERASELSV